MIKLSIIIPCYNAEPYVYELLDCLSKQVTKEVEVILIDDGSKIPVETDYKWVKLIRQDNKGLSKARNTAIDMAKGEYISFIDADDLVADDYVEKIFNSMPFDYLEMSWKSMKDGIQCGVKLNSITDRLDNPSVCTRAFSRKYLGNHRFNENKDATEDEDFSRQLGYLVDTESNRKIIPEYTYFYRTAVSNSLSKRFLSGQCKTKRIIYYYPVVTKDMTYLVDEIKKEDRFNEVWVMTNKCEIPELRRYAQVVAPQKMRGMELRGIPTSLFTKISSPVRTQVVIWTNKTFEIGGIETFIYNFCLSMKDKYDICVLYNEMHPAQIARLQPYVRVIQNNVTIPVICDTLIVNRIVDVVPSNIKAKKTIQMCHTCKQNDTYHIPQDKDEIVCVSETSKISFGEEAENSKVINNIVMNPEIKEPLLLVSATRLDTGEKGQKRMLKLASELNIHGIPYVWLYFSNVELDHTPPNMVCMKPTLDIQNYISMASYLVQLSDSESFCYSVVESLMLGTPVICTDLPVFKELGVKDKVNAHVLPLDLKSNYDVNSIYTQRLRNFSYSYDNEKIIKKWVEVLGNTEPLGDYVPIVRAKKRVRVLVKYDDIMLHTTLYPEQELEMNEDRAYYLQDQKHFVTIIS